MKERSPTIPEILLMKYSEWSWQVASRHPPQSVIFRMTSPVAETRFLKITRRGWTPSAEAEARRLRWARSYVRVPEVLEAGADDESSWFVSAGLRGRDATHPPLRSDSLGLVSLLARGLRTFHEIPSDGCPFPFRIDDALQVAQDRLEAGRIDPKQDFHVEHAHLSAELAVAELVRTRPTDEDLVVCHGDYCLPNVLIDGGRVVGYVDVGELGVADRWWDIAVASWSVTWNLGPGLEEAFIAAYGIDLDVERIRFFRLLYDVVS